MKSRPVFWVALGALVIVAIAAVFAIRSSFILTHPMMQLNHGTMEADSTALQAPYSGASQWYIGAVVNQRTTTVRNGSTTKIVTLPPGGQIFDNSGGKKTEAVYLSGVGQPYEKDLCSFLSSVGIRLFILTHPMVMVKEANGIPSWLVGLNALQSADIDPTVWVVDDSGTDLHGTAYLNKKSPDTVGLYLRNLPLSAPNPPTPTASTVPSLQTC